MINDPTKAKAIARGIVSDIVLYNTAKIRQGIKQDNLFELLEEEIQKGRRYYNSQVAPDLAKENNFFNEALVDLLFAPHGKIASEIW